MTTTPYRCYLLRLWLEPNNPLEWRAILESPISGGRHGFANLESLFEFIRQETERLEQETNTRISRTKRTGADLS
jgi:hypothetical protein